MRVSNIIRYLDIIEGIVREYGKLFPYDKMCIEIDPSYLDYKWLIHVDYVIDPPEYSSYIEGFGENNKGELEVSGAIFSLEGLIEHSNLYSRWIVDAEDWGKFDKIETWKKYEKYYPYIIKLLEKFEEEARNISKTFGIDTVLELEPFGKFYLIARSHVNEIPTNTDYVKIAIEMVATIRKAYKKIVEWMKTDGLEYYKEAVEEAERNIMTRSPDEGENNDRIL